MENKEYLQKLGIPAETMEKKPAKSKAECRKAIQEEFRARIEKATEKSKVKHMMENKTGWEPGKRAEYMDKLTRNQVSTIFKARARMLEVKANYKKQVPRQSMKDMPPRAGNPRSCTTTMQKERHTKNNKRGNLQ